MRTQQRMTVRVFYPNLTLPTARVGLPGHETTGHTMSALLSLLLRNPHVLERLRREQAAIVAQHGPGLSGAALHLS